MTKATTKPTERLRQVAQAYLDRKANKVTKLTETYGLYHTHELWTELMLHKSLHLIK